MQGTKNYTQYVNFEYKGKTYYFTASKALHSDGSPKKVYLGFFSKGGDAAHKNEALPEGIEFDKPYCLKAANVFLPIGDISHPQDRHFWDFFPFEGENLRQIIALNDDATLMSEKIRSGNINPTEQTGNIHTFRCAVLEPVYSSFDVKAFPTFASKIDCMLQIISGLKQLMADETLHESKFVAHRDLKFKNVVIDDTANKKKIRLIDFPTVKVSPRENIIEQNRTFLSFFSYSNTAPEDVMEKFRVSDKTDVFALGTMLAEIFEIWNFDGICNPLTLLFKLSNNSSLIIADECSKFYNNLNKRYPYRGEEENNWLELVLHGHDKNANWSAVERLCPDVRALFRSATAIDPKNRVTLSEFEIRLKQIYENLINENGEIEIMNSKTMYFLIDTSDLDLCRKNYLSVAEKVLNASPDTKVAMLHYGSCHASAPALKPDPAPLTLTPVEGAEILDRIGTLLSGEWDEMNESELKSCLDNLANYLENASIRNKFSGEIHIFAPVPPNEKNTHNFEAIVNGAGGIASSVSLSCEDIAAKLGTENIKIYVHTFKNEDEQNTPESWYTTVYFDEDKPDDTTSDEDTPPVTTVFKKGKGFHFIGGIPIK